MSSCFFVPARSLDFVIVFVVVAGGGGAVLARAACCPFQTV